VYRRGFKDKFEMLEGDENYDLPDAKKMTWHTYFSNGCI
jgi:hypothetical protein